MNQYEAQALLIYRDGEPPDGWVAVTEQSQSYTSNVHTNEAETTVVYKADNDQYFRVVERCAIGRADIKSDPEVTEVYPVPIVTHIEYQEVEYASQL